MQEYELKYGCNPNQKPSRIFMSGGGELPVRVLNGRPGYINFMDALNGWQLVSELKRAFSYPAAASFKHVSPAGAAIGIPLGETLKKSCFADDLGELSPLASAYVRARGADRMSSFGDFVSLSDICDESAASVIRREVSDGVIAPGYTDRALEILKQKKRGNYPILEIDPAYEPGPLERRDIFGITFEQARNGIKIGREALDHVVTANRSIPENAKRDLLVALITLKYTQSNSVCFAKEGQAIGIGAGQQSRVHCVRLAGSKADNFLLRQHPKVLELPFRADISRPERDNAIDVYIGNESEDLLSDGAWERVFRVRPDPLTAEEKREYLEGQDGVSLGSDAFFPFPDSIERAKRSGVRYIAEPGGSVRDDEVIRSCDAYGMAMAFTGIRLFHH